MTGSLRGAWRQLLAAPDRILVPTLVLSTAGIVVHVLAQYLLGVVVAGSSDCRRPYLDGVITATCGPTDARAQLTLLLGLLLLYAVAQVVVTGLYAASLGVVDEAPPRGPFAGWPRPRVLLGVLVLAFLLTINTVFLLLPAVVLGFLVRYVPLFLLDGLGPVAAVVASTRLVGSHLGSELWFVVRATGLLLGGLLLLGVGLYVAVPVVLLAQTQRYRSWQQEQEPA